MKLKVLHITNWYPDKINPFKAMWIKKHVEALNLFCDNDVYHVEIKSGCLKLWLNHFSKNEKSIRLLIPFKKWFYIEIFTTFLLIYVLIFKVRLKSYDIINFHIAYPLCTYLHLLKHFIKQPIIITEHWSAYHFNFNVQKLSKLKRIKTIFTNYIPFITVSESLKNDLNIFSNKKNIIHVIPNVVDINSFKYLNIDKTPNSLFMISYWKWPKLPLIAIKAIDYLKDSNPNIKLTVGGYGSQISEIKEFIKIRGLENFIHIKGIMTSNEIALEMNKSLAFIHPSHYETFSVVCAESLCCGTPVIGSKVGGLIENINEENGILFDNNNIQELISAIRTILNHNIVYNYSNISQMNIQKFSKINVGRNYYHTLLKYV